MTICIHTVECGPLGEVDLTISYKYRPFRAGRCIEPDEHESACIYWIKIGGESGVEVPVSDDESRSLRSSTETGEVIKGSQKANC